MAKYSEKQNKWTQDYIRKAYETITIRAKRGRKQLYQEAVAKLGMSMNEYVIQKLEELL